MTNNKQQTAVEWLFNEFERIDKVYYRNTIIYTDARKEAYEKAKEMEKERMKGMYVEGSFAKMRYYDGLEYIDAEQYYNETYGKNHIGDVNKIVGGEL